MQIIQKPEYIALFVATLAIIINVYIAWKNRKHALAKEEYFKLQQIAEKIIAKLLILETHREKLKVFFEKSYQAEQSKMVFIDINDTFDKTDFEKNCSEIVSLIEIYFDNLKNDWNICMDCMGKMYTVIFLLKVRIDKKESINWPEEAEKLNKESITLGQNPKKISNSIKQELKKFKAVNL